VADGEESAALVQLVLTNSIGEETELADADHSGGQHVQQKAAHELDRVQRHGLGTAAARVILPLESNAAIFQGAQAVVRARNAAGSARGRSSPEKRSVPLRRARRQGEHHMEIGDRQELRLPLGEPASAGRGLALGAMAIAARVI